MMRVRWTRPALADIAEIHDYIAADNPAAAKKVIRRIAQTDFCGGSPSPRPSPARGEGENLAPLSPCGRGAGGEGEIVNPHSYRKSPASARHICRRHPAPAGRSGPAGCGRRLS
ncbi:MAG: type II toxin-antitoxin system RelE/ParE family toxin [Rhodocyclales bacterium]|nr:type II toxin-antitoxin system RelE/ParE family toxin [Rhodocyclales bacterium]